MSFTEKKELGAFTSSSWYQYACGRTGVSMPNCFTYATARISEILGYNQPLDKVRVRGAGDLWEGHADEFTIQRYACEGALMIWKGGYENYGHVAVCERMIDTNTIGWSESNYGSYMFKYVKGNPNGYAGLTFMGYLHHKNLSKSKEPMIPQSGKEVENGIPSDFISESATFTSTTTINIRRAPSLKGALTGDRYDKGMSFHYDGYVKREGYLWCSYIGKDGSRRWVAVGELNSKGININPYGTFK